MVRKEVSPHGTVRYINEQGQYHREDGPAIVWKSGAKSWYIDGLCHRLDGPAIEWADGGVSYYLIEKRYSYEEWLAIKDFPLLW